jgi:hypothetical protein
MTRERPGRDRQEGGGGRWGGAQMGRRAGQPAHCRKLKSQNLLEINQYVRGRKNHRSINC